MALRTVRLTEEEERILALIRNQAGLSVSAAFKRGLRALQQELGLANLPTFWQVYQRVMAEVPDRPERPRKPLRPSKQRVLEAILAKHGRAKHTAV